MVEQDLPSEKELQSTAYHEAGHAVAAHWERVRLESATIVPGDDFDGKVISRNLLHGRNVDSDASQRNRSRMLRMVRVSLAGLAAQRRFDAESVKDWHGEYDYQKAADLVSYFTENDRELEAYLNLLLVQAEGIFDRPFVWDQVTAVAEALLAKKTLKSLELRRIMHLACQQAMDR
ncbi:MAG TPA: hypothetical protein VGV06_20665, partial [Methylomirabilota bacterium]|nr:hypothetical protein [Methylomirabilota bacterium]